MRLISKAEFARERGVHPSRVSQWLRDGRVTEAGEHGRIDADAAHARLDAHLDQAKGSRRNGNVTSSAPVAVASGPGSASASVVVASALASASASMPGAVAGGDGAASGELSLGRAPDDAAGPAGRDAALANDDRDDPAGDGARGDTPPTKPGTRDESGYWEHKARRERAEAQLAEMKALAAAGALTSAPAVAKIAREMARQARNDLLGMVDRLAPVLDPASPARAHKLLTDEVQKVIRELCRRLDERAAGAAEAREPDATVV